MATQNTPPPSQPHPLIDHRTGKTYDVWERVTLPECMEYSRRIIRLRELLDRRDPKEALQLATVIEEITTQTNDMLKRCLRLSLDDLERMPVTERTNLAKLLVYFSTRNF